MSDLVVIGAGTMGAWTALQAIRGGRSVTLVDAFGAGSPRATSGDETRISRASHGLDTFYVRWSREAREEWIAFGDEVGEPLFVEAGVVWFAHREDGFETTSLATLREMDVPAERIAIDEAARRWPQVSFDDVAFAVLEPESGLLMARRSVAAVARRVAELGGASEVAEARPGRVEGSRLIDVELGDGRRVAAEQFVFACGPWLPTLFPEVAGDLIAVTKQDVVFVGPRAGDTRFGAASLPCWIDYDASYYGVPAVDGRGFKIAPDRYGEPFDPSSDDRLVDPDSIRLARSYLARRFPDLADGPILETRTCQYETTPDTNFVIDRHPAFDNVWLVGGGSGHGFKHGPSIGRYVTRLLDGHVAEGEETRFRIDRSRTPAATGAGARRMITEWAGGPPRHLPPVEGQRPVGDLDRDPAVLDDHRVELERLLGRRVERLAAFEVEARHVQRTRQRAAGQEALVELEVLVAADALHRADLAAHVHDEHRVGAVDPDELHGPVGDLIDADEVDAPHAAALSTVPAAHLASSSSRRRSWTSASGTRATTGSRNPSTMNLRASSGGMPRLSR